ncbi:hypothetical protein [Halogeometricum borinquense]|uniref:hypothetical protein n=1 Tax=Halogeometricum borinquense TaxID=60847 RepID=UPI001EF77D13|nr:hypothetical protein [Halogeometricum borinquense]
MVNRVKVNWRVPSSEWDAFLNHIHDKHGEISGYVGREVERAMREWIDKDDFAPIEQQVNRLIRAAGRTPANLSQKKSGIDPPAGEDTTTVQCRVDPEVKDEFSSYAKSKTNDRVGAVLARALRERRDGGRANRVLEKLKRISDDAEDLLAELNPDESGLGVRERRTVAICNRLGEQFTRDDLEDAIAAVAGSSDPTIQDYTGRVLDRRECVQHPENPDLFIPESTAREIARTNDHPGPDAPAFHWKDYSSLSKREKIQGLRVELIRRSFSNGGKGQADVATVRQEIFDGKPTDGHTRDLIDRAAEANGFTTASHLGSERIRVDCQRVDSDLLDTAKSIQNDSDPRDRSGNDVDLQADQTGGNPGVASGDPGEIDAQMDAIMSATPVTDGGTEVQND